MIHPIGADRFSLWLMPQGDEAQPIRTLMEELSHRFGSVRFPPHVTLIETFHNSEEEVRSRVKELAERINPYEIRLTKAAYLNAYYRCVFLLAKQTPPVMDAYTKACEIFKSSSDVSYMPHMSLLYGNFPTGLKEGLVGEISDKHSFTFTAQSVHIFSTKGAPPDWFKIGELPLGG